MITKPNIKDTNYVSVAEQFLSIQGEGKTMGVPAVFLRTQYCNLLCCWCDTIEVWRKGVESLMTKIYASLQKVGVEKYGKIGDAFDPALHQAVGNVETTDKAQDHTIAVVMQTGYTLHDKVVRPALVKVFQA